MTTAREPDRSANADRRGMPAELWLEQPGAAAAFTPSEGFCCTAWRVHRDDRWVSLLAEPPSWEVLRARPAFFGNPLLFPYPYGLQGGAFVYNGRRHAVRLNREGNVIHGLVRDHPWAPEGSWTDGEGAHVRASITVGGGDPASDDLLAEYPFPFRLRVTYSLSDASLALAFEVTNVGQGTLPFGLGIHPYFPVPLLPGGGLEDLVVQANAPYARLMRAPGTGFVPAPCEVDITSGQRLDAHLAAAAPDGKSLLALYATRGEGDGGPGAAWSLTETRSGLTITITADDAWPYVLNFAPPTRHILSPVVSTCPPGALNALAEGRNEGIVELAPGATWRSWTRMTVGWD